MRIVAPLALATLLATPVARAQTAPAELPPIVIDSTPPAPPPPADTTPPAAPDATAKLRVVLLDAIGLGVDPTVSTYVTGVLRHEVTQLGFALVPVDDVNAAVQRLQITAPVSSENLAAIARDLHASIALTAEVRAGGGYYYPTLRARVDGEQGERFRQLFATQWTLGDMVTATLPSMLAPAGSLPPGPVEQTPPLLPDMYTVQPPPRPVPVKIRTQPVELAATVSFAGNPGQDGFFNVLLGGRVAYFPFDRFGLSAGVAYGNLQGRTQRVSNVLPALGVETAVDLLPSAHIFLPLRVEVGFLPSNGPVIRATAGLRFQISGDVHGEVGLGASVWVLPGSATVSLDGGLQLVYAFGAHAATPAAAPATPPRRRRRRASTTGSTTGATNPADGTSPPAVATPAP